MGKRFIGVSGLLLAGVLVACNTMDASSIEDVKDSSPSAELPVTILIEANLSWNDGVPSIDQMRQVETGGGYINQPSFLPGSKEYLYSAGLSKTNIFQREFGAGAARALTASQDRSEFSPRQMPDGSGFSFIQESPNGRLTTLNGKSDEVAAAAPLISLAPLGYYAFFNGGEDVAVFLRSEPASLYQVNVESGAFARIADGIGRALYPAPGGEDIYFTTADADQPVLINRFDASSASILPITALPEGAQDYAVFATPEGNAFLSASGSELMFWAAGANQWVQVSGEVVDKTLEVSRMAISDDLSSLIIITTP